MKRTSRLGLAALALGLALPLGACDDVTDGSGRGDVNVVLTDAAGEVETAIATISSIYFQGENDSTQRVYLLGDASGSADLQVTLTDLQNTIREVAQDVSVPAGTYSQIRVVLSGACIVVEGDGGADEVYATSGYTACGTATGNLQGASTLHTGIKINMPNGGFRVEEDSEQTLLVDFDVSKSFGHQAGNSGNWVLHPVIKATRAELAATANVSVAMAEGLSLPAGVALSAFTTTLTNAEGGTETMALDANGAASFRYLVPGTYTVSIAAPAGFTFAATPGSSQSVALSSGATASAAFTLTSVTAQ